MKKHPTPFQKQYYAKLKDPRWQKMRLQVFERDEWCCQFCCDSESTIVVHHRYYEKGLEPWEYPIKSLITLCERCHEEAPEKQRVFEQELMQILRKRLALLGLPDDGPEETFFIDGLRLVDDEKMKEIVTHIGNLGHDAFCLAAAKKKGRYVDILTELFTEKYPKVRLPK